MHARGTAGRGGETEYESDRSRAVPRRSGQDGQERRADQAREDANENLLVRTLLGSESEPADQLHSRAEHR